jgi:prevent-host-death family protein
MSNRLSHYLRSAKRDEEIMVTERGRPIALLQSIKVAGGSRDP